MVLRVAWFGHAGGRRADGLTAYSEQTVAALIQAGCQVRFFHHSLDGDRVPVDDAIALDGRRFKTVTMPALGTLAQIQKALADFRPDVVHTSLSVSLLDGAVARAARRVGAVSVVTCHLPYADAHSARGRVMRGLYRYHAARIRRYDMCIALSQGQRDLLTHAGVAADRVVVMRNAVATERISPGPSSLHQSLGAALIVSFLGRLDPEKRVEELVRSFLARRWPPDHLLLIAGSGSQERRLRRILGPRSPVRLLGMISEHERLELLRATDIFVLPSTAEGLSLSLLEAMAAGCAIVSTDAGEHEAVLNRAGMVIPAYPLEPGLGQALERLRADPLERRRFGEAARCRAVTEYGLEVYVADLLRLYQEIRGPERAPMGRRVSRGSVAS
ncbi:MAG TPA: glycosyltransferase family 4 protein [Candidatus Binatia bacterium]|nr:glycosyltransferase family 4 protein [Candidatus Binatia bacterium]